jgi:WD40 repeat protein
MNTMPYRSLMFVVLLLLATRTDAHAMLRAMALDPDGVFLAGATNDGHVNLWELSTGKIIQTFRGHNSGVLALAYSRDGKLLATGSFAGTARIWDTRTGKALHVLKLPPENLRPNPDGKMYPHVFAVAFSPDCKKLATGDAGGAVRLWDVKTGKQIAFIKPHKSWLNWVDFSPDGKTIVSCEHRPGVLHLWDWQAKKKRVLMNKAWMSSAVFSPNGKLLGAGGTDYQARIFDLERGTVQESVGDEGIHGTVVIFAPNNQLLASHSGTAIQMWQAPLAARLWSLRRDDNDPLEFVAALFTLDRKRVVTSDTRGLIRVFDVASRREIRAFADGDRAGVFPDVRKKAK